MPNANPVRNPRFSWLALLGTLVTVAVCVRLGVWQLERAEQKQHWQDAQHRQAALPASDLAGLLALTEANHRRAQLRGHPDNRHPLLLDNRTLNGQAGYYLLTPLYSDGHWVLINRGWLAAGRRRDQLPAIPPLPEQITFSGTAYRSPGEPLVLKELPLPDNQWPLRIQKVDFDAIGEKLGVELAPFEIRVTPGLALGGSTALPRPWELTAPDQQRMGPERHRAYALQWFALALAAALLYGGAAIRQRRNTGKSREEQ